jgi:hypothetical protein
MDAVEFSLNDLIEPSIPLSSPLPKFHSDCIYKAEHLAISYDDDFAAHYVGDMFLCEVPVNSSVPLGTTAGRDEIISLDILVDVMAPYEGLEVAVLDEESVHQNLAPNPDADTADNDDIDALDICPDESSCETWLFSPDHEAAYCGMACIFPFDPGGIYEVGMFGGYSKVIDDVIHLGLPEETDIDAFEFVWAVDPTSPAGDEVLTLLFSVDEDDYLTMEDESGGLDPGMIYASYLTGTYFQFLEDPLYYDIDAIAAWSRPIYPGSDCDCGGPGDVNNDGSTDPLDVSYLVNKVYLGQDALHDYTATCPYPNGDVNCDSSTDPLDVSYLVNKVYLSQDALCDRCP